MPAAQFSTTTSRRIDHGSIRSGHRNCWRPTYSCQTPTTVMIHLVHKNTEDGKDDCKLEFASKIYFGKLLYLTTTLRATMSMNSGQSSTWGETSGSVDIADRRFGLIGISRSARSKRQRICVRTDSVRADQRYSRLWRMRRSTILRYYSRTDRH
jgi:hypothetical protein